MVRIGCATTDCGNKHHAGGYCSGCYKRLKRMGVPVEAVSPRPKGLDIAAALRWHGWTVTASGCWEWDGIRDRQGYGQIWFEGRTRKVPRLAYTTWIGPVPTELMVRHRCDNPPCINPDHFELGTGFDNMRDKMERGRHVSVCGEDSSLAVRTAEDIREIRRLHATGWSYRRIGKQFDADPGYIGRVVRREIWKSVAA